MNNEHSRSPKIGPPVASLVYPRFDTALESEALEAWMLSAAGYVIAMRLKSGNIVRAWEDGVGEALEAGLATVNERGQLVPTTSGLAVRRSMRRA